MACRQSTLHCWCYDWSERWSVPRSWKCRQAELFERRRLLTISESELMHLIVLGALPTSRLIIGFISQVWVLAGGCEQTAKAAASWRSGSCDKNQQGGSVVSLPPCAFRLSCFTSVSLSDWCLLRHPNLSKLPALLFLRSAINKTIGHTKRESSVSPLPVPLLWASP